MQKSKLILIMSAAIACLTIFLITGRYGSLLGSAFVSLIVSLLAVPYVKEKFESIGLVAMDVQKKNKPRMATSGGVPVVIGFLFGVLAYITYTTFVSGAATDLTLIFSGLTTILLMTFLIGLFDDMIIQPEKKTSKGEKDTRLGLKQRDKLLLSIIAVFPLMAVNAGSSVISIPLIGSINLGLLYPLLIVPLIIIFCSNATNMLAGMNGLETGLGVMLLGSTGIYALLYGIVEGGIIALTITGALIGFFYYNKYPAKFLPGDSLTYLIGAGFAASVIIGNVEKFALIAFIPWFIEFLLKTRLRFKASSLGLLQTDGTLKPKHKGIHSWTHIGIRLVKKERLITPFMICVEAGFCALAFIITRLTV